MRSDSDIRRDVEDELRWTPDLDPTDIAVAVNTGVVTLAGFVRSYMQKYQAENAAKRVAGVIGVANDLEVRLPNVDERPDPEIARDAIDRIKSELPYSWEKIRAVVKNGWLTLEGEVEWNYQRERADPCVISMGGYDHSRLLTVQSCFTVQSFSRNSKRRPVMNVRSLIPFRDRTSLVRS